MNELFLRNDIIGASFFSWDNGNPHRMLALFKTLGINNLRLAKPDTIKKAMNFYRTMPRWPAYGSVQACGNVVIVKLSDR